MFGYEEELQEKIIELEKEIVLLKNKKLTITFDEYNYQCSDGCCDHYGTVTTINGKELPLHNQDYETIVEQILKHLGYEVEIENFYDDDREQVAAVVKAALGKRGLSRDVWLALIRVAYRKLTP
jgi:hypothetical protein